MPLPPLLRRLGGQTAVPAALVLLLALVAGLTYHVRSAERLHQATADRALRDYAAFAAWQYSKGIQDRIEPKVRATLARARDLSVDRRRVLDPGDPLPPASLLFPDTAHCGCGFGSDTRFAFRVDLATGELTTAGTVDDATRASLLGRVPAFAAVARGGLGLRDPKRDAMDTWARFAFDTIGGELHAFAYTVLRDGTGAARAVYGAGADPKTLDHVFRCTVDTDQLLPPTLVGTTPNDSLLHIRVTRADGAVLFTAGPEATAGPAATTATTLASGGLAVTVALQPSAASRLLIGGVPPSRLPLLLALLGAGALLAVVALVQLRRGRELSRLRGQFVANVSHELRTPLAQISMFSETLLLGRERSEEERQRFLSVIFREARRLTTLVESVLRFSRTEAGALGARLRPEPRDLAEDVAETIAAFEPLAAAAGVEIDTHLADDAAAMADPGALRQVLLNLLDNAVKYGPREQTVTVRVRRSADGGSVVVSVDDEGPGVPPADRTRIFEPFTRLDRPGLPRVSGTGIGLAVVRDLVAAQGGSVWVEDAPGSGARVSFSLPGLGTGHSALGDGQRPVERRVPSAESRALEPVAGD